MAIWSDGGDSLAHHLRARIFSLDSCYATSELACLRSHRFAVEAEWSDFAGNSGRGQLAPAGSEESALFWFFSAENWEMLVKVLDGCAINDRYWVFAAAATDVEYTLTILDTATGTVKEYTNPLGMVSPTITDTTAFAACP